jgi:hypothetical protein
MSRSIWTECAGSSRQRKLDLEAWRVVESQTMIATRKLVDSDDEQELLERLIDTVKPPMPIGPEWRGLHYLLFTPFRHPPLRWGSRFGTTNERGIWYGAKELETAFAEVAFYRLLFLDATKAALAPITVELTSFSAHVRTRRGIDLTRRPFSEHDALVSKTSYAATQAIGAEMRAAGIDAFLYRSVRAKGQGTCVGLFSPVFARKAPRHFASWSCTVDEAKVELSKKSYDKRSCLRFPRAQFEVGGKLVVPS